jgi:hypothetical protein
LVAAIVVPYAGYLLEGEAPLIEDPRGMAATALILGFVAWIAWGGGVLRDWWLAMAGGVAALGLGVIALAFEAGDAAEGFLAAFVGAIVVLLLAAVLGRVTRYFGCGTGQGVAPGQA